MLIIIKSPLQIICAVEYVYSRNLKINDVRFIYLRKYSLADRQVYNTFSFYGITDFHTIKFGNSNYIKFFGLNILTSKFLPLKIVSKMGRIITDYFARHSLFSIVGSMAEDILVLGDPNYPLYHRISSLIAGKQIVLLDDGLGSIELNFDYSSKNDVISFSFLRTEVKSCMQCITNSFLKIKSLSLDKPDHGLVLFIGQPLYEANLISISEMELLLRKIADLYSSKRIIYISHRWELHIGSFKFPANFEMISDQDLPLELFMSKIRPLPGEIASFYSSALITLKKIHPEEIVFSAFDIQPMIKIEGIGNAYDKIKSYGIDVINLSGLPSGG